ncbi:hypothetical protein MMC22_007125 [Lobaria immixta]|nr:hypothetical protein [Lobaria immixta]
MLDIYNERPEHELDLDEIDKTFPQRNFALSDYNVGRICGTKLRIAERATRWLLLDEVGWIANDTNDVWLEYSYTAGMA